MDASLGLAFSLTAFAHYRKSGHLSAMLPSIPKMKGRWKALLELVDGEVTSCLIEEQSTGQRQSFSLEQLRRLDQEKGPLEWFFVEQSFRVPAASESPSEHHQKDLMIPFHQTGIDFRRFSHWPANSIMMLQHIYASIDGQRSIADLKRLVPYSSESVDKILLILLTGNIIYIRSPREPYHKQ